MIQITRNQYQDLLAQFWQKHTGLSDRSYKRGVTITSRTDTIHDLKRLSNVFYKKSPVHNRTEWDERKVKSRYQYEVCFACGGKAQVRHHIVWLSHGGMNYRTNIVGLCNPCHAEIHDWLK